MQGKVSLEPGAKIELEVPPANVRLLWAAGKVELGVSLPPTILPVVLRYFLHDFSQAKINKT